MASALGKICNGIHGIENKIDKNLLNLGPIALNMQGREWGRSRATRCPFSLKLVKYSGSDS